MFNLLYLDLICVGTEYQLAFEFEREFELIKKARQMMTIYLEQATSIIVFFFNYG